MPDAERKASVHRDIDSQVADVAQDIFLAELRKAVKKLNTGRVQRLLYSIAPSDFEVHVADAHDDDEDFSGYVITVLCDVSAEEITRGDEKPMVQYDNAWIAVQHIGAWFNRALLESPSIHRTVEVRVLCPYSEPE